GNPSIPSGAPAPTLACAVAPARAPRGGGALGLPGAGEAGPVRKRPKPISSPGQQGTERGVAQVGKLDLHGRAAGGEGPLDLIERRGPWHTAEAKPGDLVERRAVFGKGRQATRDRDHEACRLRAAT